MATHDEAFIPDQMVLDRWGALPSWLPDSWPPSLPTNFDHLLLRECGLACGNDEAREHYALLREDGGWRIWKVSDLVKSTYIPMTAKAPAHA